MHRSLVMPIFATTFFLAFISINSFAQKSVVSLEKLGLKSLQAQLSYIPAKSFNSLVHAGSDSVSTYEPRITSVAGFYISQTEVSNKEYREFVYYVRDSMAHALLLHFQGGTNSIDWGQPINWNDNRLELMMVPSEDQLSGRMVMDAGKIKYEIDFFGQKETISIYPDTLVWIRDFSYSYNEPLVKRYFANPAYNQYPVVGISQKQAISFCRWKTGQIKKMLTGKDASNVEVIVRLPSNAEWESAAFEEKDTINLLTGGKAYRYNFGEITDRNGITVKSYKDDGHFYTGPVKSFPAGPYGLYEMKGNVNEWTSTNQEEIISTETRMEKLRSSFVVKGGGWNSSPFYLQAGVCQFFPVDAAHSFIGFRYVVNVVKK